MKETTEEEEEETTGKNMLTDGGVTQSKEDTGPFVVEIRAERERKNERQKERRDALWPTKSNRRKTCEGREV